MAILHNQSWFDMNKYGKDAIVKESKLMWVPIAPFDVVSRYLKTPIEVAASISVTEMKLQDELVDYGDSSKH